MVCLLENLENHSPYRNNSNNNNIGNIIWASSFSRSVLGFWNHPNVTICGKRVKFLEAWPMAKHSPTPPEMWSGTPNHRIHTCVYIYIIMCIYNVYLYIYMYIYNIHLYNYQPNIFLWGGSTCIKQLCLMWPRGFSGVFPVRFPTGSCLHDWPKHVAG